MLLGERGKFGGIVDVTGGEKKPPSVYGCLCTLACFVIVFLFCVFVCFCTFVHVLVYV